MSKESCSLNGDIINLNVGGTKFSTSRQTLTWIPDSFFTSLLSGRISSLRDDTGAIFIDRDPKLFAVVLNFMRTKEIDLSHVDLSLLRHEAEYFGITPLVKRLVLCEDLSHSSCGDILFHGYIPPPLIPLSNEGIVLSSGPFSRSSTSNGEGFVPGSESSTARPGSIIGVAPNGHSRNSSTSAVSLPSTHSRTPSIDLRHSRNSSADLNKYVRNDLGLLFSSAVNLAVWSDPLRVRVVRGHLNWIAVAYAHVVTCYRMRDASGWQLAFTSPFIESVIENVAINAKALLPNQGQQPVITGVNGECGTKMVAASYGSHIRLWAVVANGSAGGAVDDQSMYNRVEIGTFNLTVAVDYLFFIGNQLVAMNHTGKIGVWHSMNQHWQSQDIVPISSFDRAGSFLLLGCSNGTINYIDMQKFPLRMKDNDLLVTELYRDPSNEAITAISVYLTPKTSLCGNWIEIAYGTTSGSVRVIVQHPETVGHVPQLFQTFRVHRAPITKIMLSEKYLVSMCSEYNHVRTWTVTRFRGMISTQPGSTPLASFKIMSLELDSADLNSTNYLNLAGNDCGPYGEQDDKQVFVQKVVPETDRLYVRSSSTGKRLCVLQSVDGTTITAFSVHECEGSSRMGSRPRKYVFTGHSNGAIQIFDLSTALDLNAKGDELDLLTQNAGGPTPRELLRLIDYCDLSSTNSVCTTPAACVSPSPSKPAYPTQGTPSRLKAANFAFLENARSAEGELSRRSDGDVIPRCHPNPTDKH